MSVVALVGGVLVYVLRKPLFNWYAGLPEVDAKLVFEQQVQRVVALAARLTAWLENGSLQRYLAWLLGAALVVVAVELAPLARLTGSRGLTRWTVSPPWACWCWPSAAWPRRCSIACAWSRY